MKIGLVRQGGGICGFSAQEQQVSNAATLSAPFYKMLIEKFDAEIFILGPLQKKTKEIIQGKYPDRYREYFKKIVLCEEQNFEPDDLDLILIDAGPSLLQIQSSYRGFSAPPILFVYRALKKYINAKVLVFQADFNAPFSTGEFYDSWYRKFYGTDTLFRNRKINVFAAGLNAKSYLAKQAYYRIPELVKIYNTNPEMHSIIDLYDYPYEYEIQKHFLGIAFAGKDRGPRKDILELYVRKGIRLGLAGKWKDETISKFEELNPNFTNFSKLKDFKQVLDLYNRYGATIYVALPQYILGESITSRFYDAIKSKTIPFVDSKTYSVVEKQFGDFPELSITSENVQEKLAYFENYDNRVDTLTRLEYRYRQNNANFYDQFEKILNEIMNQPSVENDFVSINKSIGIEYRRHLKYIRDNKPTTESEILKRIDTFVNNKLTYKEIFTGNKIAKAKVMLGFHNKYSDNKDSLDEIPAEEWLRYEGFFGNIRGDWKSE